MPTTEAIIVQGLIELAKIGLSSYFQAMQLAGKTDEEVEAEYIAQRDAFYANTPDQLKDV